ncbi:hypothetical protein [Phenylobacterium sp.]|jgi:hypothetical protein|uniref:hypothetical protein n=1 Tax=Phenylobacterium sp. TaxID=1871053 RepID=UPI002F92F819
MAEIHALKITFEGKLKPGEPPWMWAIIDISLEDETRIHPTVQVAVPVPFEGQGVFEMREMAWAAAQDMLRQALAAGEGKTAEQLSIAQG